MEFKDFTEVSPYRWVLDKDIHKSLHMNSDAEIFGSAQIIQAAIADGSVQQVINVAMLPGIMSSSYSMPDIHYGYGFSIGGVAAFPADIGIVLPGGVGYDINCGVRLLTTTIPADEMEHHKESLGYTILNSIPTGLTQKSTLLLNKKEFLSLLKNGAEEIVKKYSTTGDAQSLRFIESQGKLDFSMPEVISDRAIERGLSQVGTLGGGNHFIEVQRVDEIYDRDAAHAFGLKEGNITIMIHTGSRGFGHQVATDYIERLRKRNLSRIKVNDPQLVYAEIESKEGAQYLQALNAASNYAWANRQKIMDTIMAIMEQMFHASAAGLGMRLVYDQAHNIAKFEEHQFKGQKQRVLVHRKGATRAFPPGHKEVPLEYRRVGQPVLIPGSMGTSSYVLRGTPEAMDISLGSSAHGAGRLLSRHGAIKQAAGTNVRQELKQKNILVFTHSERGLKEEVPAAYKDIDDVIAVTEGAGISKKVARLIPLIVVKG